MPREVFPTTIIKAMIPYADTGTAHSLELMLQTEQVIESFIKFQEVLKTQEGSRQEEYELSANELGGGQQMDLEGMLQAVQAVCGAEERRMLNQMLLMIRVRKMMTASQDPSLMFEAVTSFMSSEQKKQMDEIIPLISLMRDN